MGRSGRRCLTERGTCSAGCLREVCRIQSLAEGLAAGKDGAEDRAEEYSESNRHVEKRDLHSLSCAASKSYALNTVNFLNDEARRQSSVGRGRIRDDFRDPQDLPRLVQIQRRADAHRLGRVFNHVFPVKRGGDGSSPQVLPLAIFAREGTSRPLPIIPAFLNQPSNPHAIQRVTFSTTSISMGSRLGTNSKPSCAGKACLMASLSGPPLPVVTLSETSNFPVRPVRSMTGWTK